MALGSDLEMEFRILGPIEVWSEGRQVRLRRGKQRALLAELLLHRNEIVSIDRLIEDVWAGEASATSVKTAQVHISQLRKALGTRGARGGDEEILVTRSPGYMLRVEPDELDSDRFERLVEEGRRALRAADAERGTRTLLEALSLWRGPALADFAHDEFAQTEIARLEEARVSAIEERIDADLALGRHQALIGELETLIRVHPLRERLRTQLMLALYRSDRQAEALSAYQAARRMLDDELGLEPSESLQRLERAILTHDPDLDLESRGRREANEVAEPVATDSVEPIATAVDRGSHDSSRRRRRGRIVVLAVSSALIAIGVVAGVALSRNSSGLPEGRWAIGLDMPFSGPVLRGIGGRNAVRMAIDQANATGGVGGARISLVSRDDGDNNSSLGQSPTRGAKNTKAFTADPRIIAMVGPSGSPVAMAEIPITNAAGLLQCSPSTTNPALTKPRNGALDLRAVAPGRINYIRVAPSDDIQGPAAASFLFDDLGVRRLLVIDDSGDGRSIADAVSAAFEQRGGTVIRRALNPGADPREVLTPLKTGEPRMGVYFGGFADTGAPDIRKAMVAASLGKLPFVSWDGIGGSGAEAGSYIQRAGRAAVGSYQSAASFGPPKADFVNAYRAEYGSAPDDYTVAAYACAQVILDALRMVASEGTSATGLREALREQAVDPSHEYRTALGTIGFDTNGDSRQQFVTFYRVDPSAAGGKGDWILEKQQDYGPAP